MQNGARLFVLLLVRAAGRVGDAGTVYTVDINPEAIRYIESRIGNDNLYNFKPILGQPDNPLLLLWKVAAFVSPVNA
jgi:hypothetical protein